MKLIKNPFIYSPGPGNEGGSTPEKDKETEKEEARISENKEEPHEHKPLAEKIKEVLQDWSNEDQADQDFDDTRV